MQEHIFTQFTFKFLNMIGIVYQIFFIQVEEIIIIIIFCSIIVIIILLHLFNDLI